MPLIRNRGKSGYFNQYILNRIRRNKNFVCAITGGTGSGKSYSALKLASDLDPNFDVRNICFTAKEFLDLVDGKTKELKKGANIIWDEMQVTMSHLDYQTQQAKLLNYVLQTFRYQNFVLWITTPHFSFVNASSRKLFHGRFETVGINQNEKLCVLKPFLLQTNQKSGDIYQKYLRVKVNGVVTPLRRIHVNLADLEILKAYENKKDKFNQRLREDIRLELTQMEEGNKKKPLTANQLTILEFLKQGKVIPEIAEELGITNQAIYQQMNYIKRKGVIIKPEKEKGKITKYIVEGA